MKCLAAVFFAFCSCLALIGNVEAQIIIMQPENLVKVDVKVDEKIHDNHVPFKSVPGKRTRKKTVQLKDKLMVFCLWKKEGVYQILARKRPVGFAKSHDFTKTIRFEEVWNADYESSMKNVDKIYHQLSSDSGRIQTSPEIVGFRYFRNAYFDRSEFYLPFAVGPVTNTEWLYYPISIKFFKYSEKEASQDSTAYNFQLRELDSYYFVWMGMQLTKNERYWMRIFDPDQFRYFRQLEFIVHLMCYQDMAMKDRYIPKLEMVDFSFPMLSERRIAKWHQTAALSRADQETIAYIENPDKYNASFLKVGSCIYGYVVKANPEFDRRGLLVIPEKFILPYRFKIVTVNDIPWETYKNQLCGK